MSNKEIPFLNHGQEVLFDSNLMKNENSLFYKIQNQLLDASLLAKIQKDEEDLLISYPGKLGHTIFSWKSLQGTSWVVSNADIKIRSAYCLSQENPIKSSSKSKALKDIIALSLDGTLVQGKTPYLSSMKLSLRSKFNSSKNFAMSYSNLEPYAEDGESFTDNETTIDFWHNLDEVKNFNPDFLKYLSPSLLDSLPKQRSQVHQFVSEGFKNNLQARASSFESKNKFLSFPQYISESQTQSQYSLELIKMYENHFK